MQNIFFITTPESKLSPLQTRITEILEAELPALREVYEFKDFFNITIHNLPDQTIPSQGCGGFAASAEWMQILVDEENELFGTEQFFINIKNTLIHEFNHVVRWSSVGYGDTVLEAIISEGIATAFEKEYGKADVEWGRYTDEDVETYLKVAKNLGAEGLARTGVFDEYLFGNDDDIPHFFGYRLGTYIIETLRAKNLNLSWKEITNMTAEEIVEQSKIHLV